MNILKRSLILVFAISTLSACASTGDTPTAVRTGSTSLGTVFTDNKGMTLYTYDKDSRGKSTCNGKCAENWPPLTANSDTRPAGKFTVVTRDDGSRQWAYEGKPLYGWVKDAKPGDVTGHRFKDVWTAAMPKQGYTR